MARRRILIFGLAAALIASPHGASAACKLAKIAILPVTMQGGEPMVPAKINGVDVQLIADTGTSFSFLTPGNAAQLHIPLHQAPLGMRGESTDGDIDLDVATVRNLTLSGQDLGRTDFLVGGNEYGSSNVGLLAQNVLGVADGEYDLANGMISLVRADGCSGQPLVYWAQDKPYSVVAIDYPQEMRLGALTPPPVATAYLNGVAIKVKFDTGADRSVLSLRAAARAGIKPDSPGVVHAGLQLGKRKYRDIWIAPFNSFKIGDEEIKNTKIIFEDIRLNDADMLLGNDFFLSHHVYIANSQRKLYFTYIGGAVFNYAATPLQPGQPIDGANATATAPEESDPKDAEGYSRRGQARLARRDFAGALADLDRAVALAPTEPRYFQERGFAHNANKQPFLAMQDFDEAVRLKPDFVPALIARGEMRLSGRQEADALADFDAAARLLPKEADQHILLGQLYSRLQRFDQAIPHFDAWIKAHPEDDRRSVALNGRCWARAQLGQDLQQALADCNASLRQTKSASAFDSRGMVELRLGDYEKAIADYDASLALSPKLAWSLYGRGVARIRTGHAADGRADIDAAVALNAALPGLAKAHGVPTP